jgi:hypothetical protein
VNLTKIFFFWRRICQIVHIQKYKNKFWIASVVDSKVKQTNQQINMELIAWLLCLLWLVQMVNN